MEKIHNMNIDYAKKSQEVRNSVDDEGDEDDFSRSKKTPSNHRAE